MLTRGQQAQIRTAFKLSAFGGRIVFVTYHESQAREFVEYLRSTYGDKMIKAKRVGRIMEVRCCDGPDVLRIEPFYFRDQFQGMEFSGAFVDEFAVLDREAFNFLISRVRRT